MYPNRTGRPMTKIFPQFLLLLQISWPRNSIPFNSRRFHVSHCTSRLEPILRQLPPLQATFLIIHYRTVVFSLVHFHDEVMTLQDDNDQCSSAPNLTDDDVQNLARLCVSDLFRIAVCDDCLHDLSIARQIVELLVIGVLSLALLRTALE